jgi:hypothetical protein
MMALMLRRWSAVALVSSSLLSGCSLTKNGILFCCMGLLGIVAIALESTRIQG